MGFAKAAVTLTGGSGGAGGGPGTVGGLGGSGGNGGQAAYVATSSQVWGTSYAGSDESDATLIGGNGGAGVSGGNGGSGASESVADLAQPGQAPIGSMTQNAVGGGSGGSIGGNPGTTGSASSELQYTLIGLGPPFKVINWTLLTTAAGGSGAACQSTNGSRRRCRHFDCGPRQRRCCPRNR